MIKKITSIIIVLVFGALVGFFVFKSEPKLNHNFQNESSFFKSFPFRLGLDLSGGSHLIYKADVSQVQSDVSGAMDALRDVIERRINLFGVSEPVVQVESSGFVSGGDEKLIVDLPGVTDVEKATALIGQTPLLEFKVEAPVQAPQKATVDKNGKLNVVDVGPQFVSTGLTGRYLKQATLEFNPTTNAPTIGLQFDDIGTKLFDQITKNNVGKVVAIYLDGAPISAPVVNEEIPNGQAVISGSFTPTEAKTLVGRLNSGALPVPITLLSRQTIGASLGSNAVAAGVKAAIIGFLVVALFLILWYRLPGFIAVLALSIYTATILALFKLLPVTLTAAGIAGFIISIGIAVDANILIFERLKEEMHAGHTISESVSLGFHRAWSSIRDSNTSTIISAIILFWFGTPLIQGFALTLGMGVLVSMFSAVMVSRIFLSGLVFVGEGKVARFLFNSGFSK
jgi:protein-export membrane protein SecD